MFLYRSSVEPQRAKLDRNDSPFYKQIIPSTEKKKTRNWKMLIANQKAD
jgi:hypothetical protein